MLLIGIPCLNERDNITNLVSAIDCALVERQIDATIVVSDSASEDGTAECFLATKTLTTKHLIRNDTRGKGRALYGVLDFFITQQSATHCVFFDGDLRSFQSSWLDQYVPALADGADLVIPTYARLFQEGNTTNHFAYPLLWIRFGEDAPRQPISGDFGVSRRFAERLVSRGSWPEYALGYGVDIFMTTTALLNGLRLREVVLGEKLHNPSFGKMIPMFEQVAHSYYATIAATPTSSVPSAAKVLRTQRTAPPLLPSAAVSVEDLENRFQQAVELMNKIKPQTVDQTSYDWSNVDDEAWSAILLAHESRIGLIEPALLARDILPWFLLRVVYFLRAAPTPEVAMGMLSRQYEHLHVAARPGER